MNANNNREGLATTEFELTALRLDLEDRQRAALKTLRDEFAMTALVNCSDHIGNPEDMARAAYEIADAMMTARGQSHD